MSYFLRVGVVGVALQLLWLPAWAQRSGVTAGQTSGLTVTILNPPKHLETTAGPCCTQPNVVEDDQQRDSLDLDQDGRFDVRFTASRYYLFTPAAPGSYPDVRDRRSTTITLLHNDVQLLLGGRYITPFAFASGDSLSATSGSISAYGTWWQYSNLASDLYSSSASRLGVGYSGYWSTSQYKYIGIRLRAGNRWRFGWINVQIPQLQPTPTINIDSYALQSTALAVRQVTGGNEQWQLFPVPALDHARIQFRQPTSGELCVLDALGRPVQRTTLHQQTAQLLDLTSLPAGMYAIQLTTTAGRSWQRLQKL